MNIIAGKKTIIEKQYLYFFSVKNGKFNVNMKDLKSNSTYLYEVSVRKTWKNYNKVTLPKIEAVGHMIYGCILVDRILNSNDFNLWATDCMLTFELSLFSNKIN